MNNETIDSAVDTIMTPIINAIKSVFVFIFSNDILRPLTYLLIINIIGFVLMYRDKKIAEYNGKIKETVEDENEYKQKASRRISESTLLASALMGGSIGVLLGMNKFRHKTQKPKFTIGVPAIIALQVVFILYLIIKNLFLK